jgi:copper homeostasis protein
MSQIKLEICAFTFEGCSNANKGGADRVELSGSIADGGITPSYGLVKKVKESLDIPVYPLVRPRPGDFIYSDDEFELMLDDIELFKSLKCEGIAIGILKEDNKIDLERLKRLVDKAWPMGVTFIRAFDLVPNIFEAIDELIQCGCERVLTSGQAVLVTEALPLIEVMNRIAGQKIKIMPGSGIRPENVELIVKATNVREIHTSVRVLKINTIGSGFSNKFGFGNTLTNNLDQIREIRNIIDNC